MPSEEAKRAYREAYEGWQRQLQRVHALLLDGEPLRGPDAVKGLLNREERAKQRYDEARRELLGIVD